MELVRQLIYRHATPTDLANNKQRATAISTTMLMTTFGAVLGPNLVEWMGKVAVYRYSSSSGSISIICFGLYYGGACIVYYVAS